MTVEQIFNIINIFQVGLLVKLFLSVLGLFYFVFTVVVFRQIGLMTQILESKIAPIVKTISLIEIVAALFLFFLIVVLA